MESKLFTTYSIGPITLKNRSIRSAAFESMCENHAPTKSLADYHKSVAEGGVGMTTVAYAAVTSSGLSFKRQLWMRPEIVADLKKITDDIHALGAKVAIQLGHCGNMSKKSVVGQTPMSASRGFNIYSPTFVKKMSRKDIDEVAKSFGTAVNLAREAGFDAVEIHAGHGYLISQFLSPYTNYRKDEFGGSLENRMRFMRMCMAEVMKAAGDDIAVLVKTNMSDYFRGGNEIEEGIIIAQEIEKCGAHAIVLSGGFVSKSPMQVMRGNFPKVTMFHYNDIWWLRWAVRFFGQILSPSAKFEECYFLEDAKRFQRFINIPLVYVGGIVKRENVERVLNSNFELFQIGRALITQPDFVNRMKEEEDNMDYNCGCGHSNYCIGRMYTIDMKCHKCVENLPNTIKKEIEKGEKK